MSRKNYKKILLFILAAAVMLGICGCGSTDAVSINTARIRTDDSPNAVKNLTVRYPLEVASLSPLCFKTNVDIELLTNLYDSLVSLDSNNSYIPCLAESWESAEDNTVWTFHLKKDAYWVNYKGEKCDRIVSKDFITGLELVLNPQKVDCLATQMVKDLLIGASEYYDKMSSLSSQEARNVPIEEFMSTVGIETPDDQTVVYKCAAPCPYFLSIATSTALMPAPSRHIAEVGLDEFLRNSVFDAWYSGPYLLTEFIPENERILDANPHWHGNADHTRFLSITQKCIPENSVCLSLYNNGELDYADLSQSRVKYIMDSDNQDDKDRIVPAKLGKFPYSLYLNYNKLNEDGTRDDNWNHAALNDSFRNSLKYGMDFTPYFAQIDPLNKYGCQIATMCLDNLCTTSGGRDYSELVLEKLGLSEIPTDRLLYFDNSKALAYKKQAMTELSAAGVTFPVILDYYVSSSQSNSLSNALILKSCIEGTLGKDYIEVRIKTYVSNVMTEVFYKNLHSAYVFSYGADYADPRTLLSQYIYADPLALMATMVTNMDDLEKYYNQTHDVFAKPFVEKMQKYTKMYREADAISNIDERLNAFAEAEAYMLENNLVGFTMFRQKGYCFSKIDMSSFIPSICSDCSSRYVDIKTDKNGYRK